MDLLQNLKMSLLNVSFLMIYLIHIMLVLLKNHVNYLKDSIFEYFFKEYNRLSFFFFKKTIFFKTHNDDIFSLEEENIIKDIRNLFRLKRKN